MAEIICDIDGVLRNIHDPLKLAIKRIYDIDLEFNKWNFWNDYSGLTREDVIKIMYGQHPIEHMNIWYYAKPYLKNIHWIKNRYEDHTDNIHFVSAQKPSTMIHTIQWLMNYFPEEMIDNIHFTDDKSLIDADIFIDDSPHKLQEALIYKKYGKVVCVNQPWNKNYWIKSNYFVRNNTKFIRVNNLQELDKWM